MTRFLLTTRLVGFVCADNNAPFVSSCTRYRRLNKLRKAGFIKRSLLLQTGEYTYHLTPQGVQFLNNYDGAINIPRKASKAPSITMQAHEFDVSRFWIKFFSDSKKLNIPTLQFWRDGAFTYQTKDKKLILDGTALLRIKGRVKVFFLELDRSTQTSGISGNEQAIIRQKLIRYRQLFRAYKSHPELVPYRPCQMRMMFVCKTQERANNLKSVAQFMNLRNLVCFTSRDRFLDISNPYTAQGWNYKNANLFSTPLFSYPTRSPPSPLL